MERAAGVPWLLWLDANESSENRALEQRLKLLNLPVHCYNNVEGVLGDLELAQQLRRTSTCPGVILIVSGRLYDEIRHYRIVCDTVVRLIIYTSRAWPYHDSPRVRVTRNDDTVVQYAQMCMEEAAEATPLGDEDYGVPQLVELAARHRCTPRELVLAASRAVRGLDKLLLQRDQAGRCDVVQSQVAGLNLEELLMIHRALAEDDGRGGEAAAAAAPAAAAAAAAVPAAAAAVPAAAAAAAAPAVVAAAAAPAVPAAAAPAPAAELLAFANDAGRRRRKKEIDDTLAAADALLGFKAVRMEDELQVIEYGIQAEAGQEEIEIFKNRDTAVDEARARDQELGKSESDYIIFCVYRHGGDGRPLQWSSEENRHYVTQSSINATALRQGLPLRTITEALDVVCCYCGEAPPWRGSYLDSWRMFPHLEYTAHCVQKVTQCETQKCKEAQFERQLRIEQPGTEMYTVVPVNVWARVVCQTGRIPRSRTQQQQTTQRGGSAIYGYATRELAAQRGGEGKMVRVMMSLGKSRDAEADEPATTFATLAREGVDSLVWRGGDGNIEEATVYSWTQVRILQEL